MNADNIYAQPRPKSPFEFNDEVVRVFDDMISRSVPSYRDNLPQIRRMAVDTALSVSQSHSSTRIYDLGCSLGACLLPIANDLRNSGVECIGIDNSQAMVRELNQRSGDVPVSVICGDIEDVELENASVVILNYTLQFFPVERRNNLLRRICDSLLPDGILILSEKIKGETPQIDEFLIRYHHEFKKLNGYSDLEISQKRQALENVMITETINEHFFRLEQAGFAEYCVWHQNLNFASIYARK